MNIVEFNQMAKNFFTPEELEKFAEYIRESSPKLTMVDGEPFLDYSKLKGVYCDQREAMLYYFKKLRELASKKTT